MKTISYQDPAVDSALGPFCSIAMQDLSRLVARIASSGLNILIVGESGSGKEWLARRIHSLSGRANAAFLPFSCSVGADGDVEHELFGFENFGHPEATEIVRGVFEVADGGTVFLDDVSHLPPASQIKLAAALEHGTIHRVGGPQGIPFDTRIIAALDGDPEVVVANGVLRKNLFYRISPVIIELPPLRMRKDDIPLLIEKFLREANERHGCSVTGMSAESLRLCMIYDWPGNIRELRNAIDYAVLMSRDQQIIPVFLPHYVSDLQRMGQTIELQKDMNVASVEKLLIEQALNESRTKKQAAKRLGISLKTLYNKLSRYNLYDKFVNYSRPRNSVPDAGSQALGATANLRPQLAGAPSESFPLFEPATQKRND